MIQDSENLEARAMIRKEEQASFFKNLGAETTVVDLEDDIDSIAKADEGTDAIVYTARSRQHSTNIILIIVDLDGAINTIEAAKIANVKRFVMISFYDTTREAIKEFSYSFAPYVVANH